MEKKYSVAIYPSQEVNDAVKTMKEYLKGKIGWYNSCNSVAHITICEFTVDESQIEKYKQKLFKICDTFDSFPAYLDHFDSYKTGAFYVAPNETSKMQLKNILQRTQNTLQASNLKKSSDPHLSIGRRLTPENLRIASQLFTTIDINFLCCEIVLREFDPVNKQFFVLNTFSFNGNTTPEFVQGTLF